jgi:hypothetical protein
LTPADQYSSEPTFFFLFLFSFFIST